MHFELSTLNYPKLLYTLNPKLSTTFPLSTLNSKLNNYSPL